jgi:putative membrane protein
MLMSKTVSMMGVLALVATAAMAQSPTTTSGQEPATGQSPSDQPSAAQPSAEQAEKDRGMAGHEAASPAATSVTAASASAAVALDKNDQKFIEAAARHSLSAVELGRLAAEKASSPDVKAFGQMMVDQHNKATEELKTLASRKGVTVPTEAESSYQSQMSKLQALSGDEFDKQYMKQMVNDHKKDVKEFKKASEKAKDEDVKQFAAKQLPTLEQHLQQAEQTVSMGSAEAGTRATGASSNSTSESTSGSSATGASSAGSANDDKSSKGQNTDESDEKGKDKAATPPDGR